MIPKLTVLALVMVAACADGDPPVDVRPPSLRLPDVMMQGVPDTATLAWGPVYHCGLFAFNCEEPTGVLTILSVQCDGCALSGDLTDRPFVDSAPIPLIATDDAVELTVTVRYDPTGEVQTLTARSLGDHELGLEVACKILASNLAVPDAMVADSHFRDCTTAPSSNERVVVFPAIRTLRRGLIFPFCPDGARCDGVYAPYRPRSTIVITPAPVGWGFSQYDFSDHPEHLDGDFAILPPYAPGEPITVSLPLFTGEVVTSTVPGPSR